MRISSTNLRRLVRQALLEAAEQQFHPDADPDDELADSTNSLAIMQKLSDDPNFVARVNVARNPKASRDILEKLAEDDNEWVQSTAIYNLLLGRSLNDLDHLADHKNRLVRSDVAATTNSPAIMQKLSNDPHPIVREKLAKNPNIRTDILEKLAQDNNEDVKRAALSYLETGPFDSLSNARRVRDSDMKM